MALVVFSFALLFSFVGISFNSVFLMYLELIEKLHEKQFVCLRTHQKQHNKKLAANFHVLSYFKQHKEEQNFCLVLSN